MKLLLACGGLLLAVCPTFAGGQTPADAANAKSLGLVGKAAPEFNLPDFREQTFDLMDQRGQVVVLAFWATWCPPCRSEMPMLARLQKELASKGVAVVPIAFDDPAKAKEFLTKKNIDVRSLMDKSGAVAALYGAHALPKTFVIDRNGLVLKAFVGKVSEDEIRSAVQSALK